MMATLMNLGVGLSAGAVLAYVLLERIRVMNWRSHPAPVVAMHVLVAIMLGSIAYCGLIDESIVGEIGYADDVRALGEVAAVLVSALWLWASRRAFREGQGGHPQRRTSDYMPLEADAPYKLEPEQLHQVAGGQQ